MDMILSLCVVGWDQLLTLLKAYLENTVFQFHLSAATATKLAKLSLNM